MRSQSGTATVIISIVAFLLCFLTPCDQADANTNHTKPLVDTPHQESRNIKLNTIRGSIFSLQHDDLTNLRMSLMSTRILVNYGQYIGHPREDGTFEVNNLPPDSYVVEVTHPRYIYEPIRVDITSKGRIRARRVNHIQPSLVQTLDYPLIFKPKSLHNYFMPRETWRILDLLLNPMVIMMVVPLALIWVLPKMMSPQEVQSQRENMQVPDYQLPELSEMMAGMFGQQKKGTGDGASTSQAALTGSGQSGGASSGSAGAGSSSSGGRHAKVKRR